MLSPGDKLKDYEVIAPLTSGGMATLFLARRRGVGGFSRLVALKLVHQHLTEDSAMIKLFLVRWIVSLVRTRGFARIISAMRAARNGGAHAVPKAYGSRGVTRLFAVARKPKA